MEPLRYKRLISRRLEHVLTTPFIKQCIKRLSFEDYKFSIANMQDVDEIYDLILYCYTKYHGYFALFGMSKEWKEYYKKGLEMWINDGRCFIATNTVSNEIIACVCFEDMCDVLQSSVPALPAGRSELSAFYDFDKVRSMLKRLSGDTYGNLFEVHFQCKNDKEKKPFLSFFLTFVVGANVLMNECGYKYCYGLWHSMSNIRMVNSMGAGDKDILMHHDWSKHVFEDGTNMTYYLNRLQTKMNYNERMMNKIKRNCCPTYIVINARHIGNGIQMMKDRIGYPSLAKL